MSNSYVVCGCKSWNRQVFDEAISALPGEWHYVGSKDELTTDYLRGLNPRYVFFLHWSWIVPKEIFETFECVNFHMTDLPYGRGGSPLQNLILQGHKNTKLTAHKMVEELDAGPIYLKKDLSLEGTAQEILERACTLSAEMIKEIISEEPEPIPQSGEVVIFERRKPEQSRMPENASVKEQYDFIRMLDAGGYPPAFLEREGFRYEYRNARVVDGRLDADITKTPSL